MVIFVKGDALLAFRKGNQIFGHKFQIVFFPRWSKSMRFLDEKDAVPALQSMLASSDVATLVVAFWGKGAADRLGLTQRSWKQLTVVCNLFSGACNPHEIKYLRDNVDNLVLLKSSRLHGKVYMTPGKAVLGSSNASTNGLVVEGDLLAGWSEANIETDDPATLKSTAAWCEKQMQDATKIDDDDLKLAEHLWEARKNLPAHVSQQNDLFSACRSNPDAFNLVDVVLWEEGLSVAGKKKLAQLSTSNDDIYEGWDGRLKEEHWALDVCLSGGPPSFTGIFKIGATDGEGYTHVRRSEYVLLQGRPKLSLSQHDQSLLEKRARQIFKKDSHRNGLVIPLAKFIEEIDKQG